MKKLVLLLLIIFLVLAITVPAYADADWSLHPHNCPAQGDGATHHRIPPGWANENPPGPQGYTLGH